MCKNADGTPAPATHFARLSQAEYITTPSSNDPEIVKEAIDAAVEDKSRPEISTSVRLPPVRCKNIPTLDDGTLLLLDKPPDRLCIFD
jgi:hypothetical protein